MNVEEAEAALALAEAEEAWLKAKQGGKKNAAYLKAQADLIAARDDYRNNHRQAGPGSATPAALDMRLEVK